jgi:hypothetical protein
MSAGLKVATCIGCGCTDNHACYSEDNGACYWLDVDREARLGVCSECRDELPRWNAGDRTPAPGHEGDRP